MFNIISNTRYWNKRNFFWWRFKCWF